MATSPGRAGVAPSLEECVACGKRAQMGMVRIANGMLCWDCWETRPRVIVEGQVHDPLDSQRHKAESTGQPPRERCPICRRREVLRASADGEMLCSPCCAAIGEALLEQDKATVLEVLGHRAVPQPDAAATVPDELAAWFQPIVRLALEDQGKV